MARVKSSSKTAASGNGDAGSNGTATASKKKIPSSALQMSSAAESKASVSEDRIRQRAYELYMQRGAQHGKHVDDWFRAEAELRGRR